MQIIICVFVLDAKLQNTYNNKMQHYIFGNFDVNFLKLITIILCRWYKTSTGVKTLVVYGIM